MATSVPICDICMTDDTTKPASVWCAECEEAICKDCEQQHSRMKLTKNHQPIPIEDYRKLPSSVADITQECKVHNRELDFYCLIHNEPCCVSCVSQKHYTCKTLKPLTEVVEGVKSSAAFEDLEDRAKDISELICNLIKDKQDNKARIEFQKKRIISEVQNVRKAIIKHLDKLQLDLLDKLDNEEKEQRKRIDSFIKTISEMRTNVDQIVRDLKQIKQHASEFQAFLGIHELNTKIEKKEKDWMSFQTDQTMDNVDIHIKFSPIFMMFEKDVKELGELEVKFLSSQKILLKKEKQGQMLVPISYTIDTIKLTNICSFQTPDGESRNILITGIDMFDDGRIVLADSQQLNKRLVIMNQKGGLIKTVPVVEKCFDVAVIDKDTVATTLTYERKVIIVDINLSKVQRTLPMKDNCYGIINTGEQFVVSLWNKTIQFFDLSGKTLSTLSTADYSFHCSVLNDKLYYTTFTSDAVYSTELNGEICWKFDCQKSADPTGIINDASGNIFIACLGSNQLMVVGRDGEKSRVLLTEKDGLQKPIALHYNRKTNILLVCNRSGKCLQYKVAN
ncbi:E3 ubiquitin-protein ligase TRIM71-like isoform X1 [Mytilus californianus]|uniref:E3 ubiquitin-protein ligase TRIM71-like isoform X1 n=1 Tax=Mytilus californianus TaxID=6549 RepID=UPI002247CBF3|nr:E3 ubiquitin-protein ligase TRIM71-like isoform X1 [Mytilus californianus]XP_052082873.1 E3 ubiquitin-protein ligase TRIM71-like isoform X1 [Mytilus californianus]XP_052082874.1 E3 ubiquitin-protein ligase TRIM71-like isoform X1 [Mytilus californianus]XP_052082876.1 E3 ubiquitin-protein ligase TRIM71-like isoform X1 [Mytilus californianus]